MKGKTLETVGDRIREVRNRKGWTQTYLAERVGIATSAISTMERSKYAPAADKLADIADALGVSMSYLLGRRS